MENNLILTSTDDRIGHIVLNRPAKRNALNRALLEELVSALRKFERDEHTRVVILSGAGNTFTAGADLGELADASAIDLFLSGFSEKWDEVANFTKPLIAAVSGYVLGGGLELALNCDIIVADETAVFGLPEVAVGSLPGSGGTQRLTRSLGKSMAMEIVLGARRLNAQQALDIGLISTLTDKGQAIEAAKSIASRIAAASPLALAMAKTLVLGSYETSLSAGVRQERIFSALIAASDDQKEGFRAFSAKEAPKFTGK